MKPVLATLLAVFSLAAQAPTGQIRGRITDPSSAPVVNSAVESVNLATGVQTRTVTNAEGLYQLRALVPGQYRIEVTSAGFKRYTREPIEVRVGDIVTIDAALDLGAASESITVQAEAPLLEAATASLGNVVDNKKITDLPVPGGSVFYLMQFTPGVISTATPTNFYGPNEMGPPSNVVSNGTRAGGTEFAVDGNPLMSGTSVTFNPPQEMVQEFRVQTAAYDASAGRFAGAQINLVMKSGTNSIHGALVYTNFSRGLMAMDYFTKRFVNDPRTGPISQAKIDDAWPPQRTVQYRATVSGPLIRSRTFWMYGVQIMDRRSAARAVFTVPDEAQRRGDFSQLLRVSSRYQIFDPATITPAPGGRTSRQPFAGNIVPASRIHPTARRLLEFYPLPNTTGTADGTNNYTDPGRTGNDFDTHSIRLDHLFSERHRTNLSGTFLDQQDFSRLYFNNIASGLYLDREQRGAAWNHNWTIRPDLIADFRYGLNRYRQYNFPPGLGYDLSQLGLPASLINQLDTTRTTLPETVVTGHATIGVTSGTDVTTTYHTGAGSLTHIRGGHTFKAGAELRVLQENSYNFGNVSPTFSFGTSWTQGPFDNSPGAPTGQGLAALLLGQPTGGGVSRNASVAEQSKYVGLFFQDDWKVSRKVTLTLGLRYERDLPVTERFNRAIRGFDFNAALPFAAAAQAAYAAAPIAEVPASRFRTVGSLQFAGGSVPRTLWDGDKNNFAPRIGVAWQVRQSTVIRAGYGIFYEPMGSDRTTVSQLGFSRTTPLVPTIDNGVTFRANVSNPFPDGILEPEGAALGFRAGLGTGVSYFEPLLRNAYNQRWSFNVQRELYRHFLIDVGYVGNRASGLALTQQYNPVPRESLSTSPFRDQPVINSLSQIVSNPFFGLSAFEGAGLQGRNTSRAQLLRPYPHFTGISAATNEGYSSYHSLQTRLEKRMSRGYTVTMAYTWSKLMEAVSRLNETDPLPHRVISSLDRTHVVALSAMYELPFKPRNHIARAAIGGWQIQAIYQAQNGPPIDFGNVLFLGDIKNITVPVSQRDPFRWFNVDAGFDRDPARQLANNLRTFPLRFNNVRADGFNNWNASAIKSFRIREGIRMEVRGEAVDVFNIASFPAPNAAPTSTAFGQITTARAQRRLTVFGKLSW